MAEDIYTFNDVDYTTDELTSMAEVKDITFSELLDKNPDLKLKKQNKFSVLSNAKANYNEKGEDVDSQDLVIESNVMEGPSVVEEDKETNKTLLKDTDPEKKYLFNNKEYTQTQLTDMAIAKGITFEELLNKNPDLKEIDNTKGVSSKESESIISERRKKKAEEVLTLADEALIDIPEQGYNKKQWGKYIKDSNLSQNDPTLFKYIANTLNDLSKGVSKKYTKNEILKYLDQRTYSKEGDFLNAGFIDPYININEAQPSLQRDLNKIAEEQFKDKLGQLGDKISVETGEILTEEEEKNGVGYKYENLVGYNIKRDQTSVTTEGEYEQGYSHDEVTGQALYNPNSETTTKGQTGQYAELWVDDGEGNIIKQDVLKLDIYGDSGFEDIDVESVLIEDEKTTKLSNSLAHYDFQIQKYRTELDGEIDPTKIKKFEDKIEELERNRTNTLQVGADFSVDYAVTIANDEEGLFVAPEASYFDKRDNGEYIYSSFDVGNGFKDAVGQLTIENLLNPTLDRDVIGKDGTLEEQAEHNFNNSMYKGFGFHMDGGKLYAGVDFSRYGIEGGRDAQLAEISADVSRVLELNEDTTIEEVKEFLSTNVERDETTNIPIFDKNVTADDFDANAEDLNRAFNVASGKVKEKEKAINSKYGSLNLIKDLTERYKGIDKFDKKISKEFFKLSPLANELSDEVEVINKEYEVLNKDISSISEIDIELEEEAKLIQEMSDGPTRNKAIQELRAKEKERNNKALELSKRREVLNKKNKQFLKHQEKYKKKLGNSNYEEYQTDYNTPLGSLLTSVNKRGKEVSNIKSNSRTGFAGETETITFKLPSGETIDIDKGDIQGFGVLGDNDDLATVSKSQRDAMFANNIKDLGLTKDNIDYNPDLSAEEEWALLQEKGFSPRQLMDLYEKRTQDKTNEILQQSEELDVYKRLMIDKSYYLNQSLENAIQQQDFIDKANEENENVLKTQPLTDEQREAVLDSEGRGVTAGELSKLTLGRLGKDIMGVIGGSVGLILRAQQVLLGSVGVYDEKDMKQIDSVIEQMDRDSQAVVDFISPDVNSKVADQFNKSMTGQMYMTFVDMVFDIAVMKGSGSFSMGKTAFKKALKSHAFADKAKGLTKEFMKWGMGLNPSMALRTFQQNERFFMENPEWDNVSRSGKLLYSAGTAFIIGKLDKLGIEATMIKGGDELVQGILSKVMSKAKPGDDLGKITMNEIKRLVAQNVIKIGAGQAGEILTENLQSVFEWGAQDLMNALNGFDGTLEGTGFVNPDWGSTDMFNEMIDITMVAGVSSAPISIGTSGVEIIKNRKNKKRIAILSELGDTQFDLTHQAYTPAMQRERRKVLMKRANDINDDYSSAEANADLKIHDEVAEVMQRIPVKLRPDLKRKAYENLTAIKYLKEELYERDDQGNLTSTLKIDKNLAEGKLEEIKELEANLVELGKETTVKGELTGDAKVKEDYTYDPLANVKNVVNLAAKEGVEIIVASTPEEVKKYSDELDLKMVDEKGAPVNAAISGDGNTILVDENLSAMSESGKQSVAHDFLHHFLAKTLDKKGNEGVVFSMGNAIDEELGKLDVNKIKDSEFKKRVELYNNETADISAEEKLTLLSDALATGDIKLKENVVTKFQDFFRRLFQSFGANIKLNNSTDVLNLIKDYNKSIGKGKFTKAQKGAMRKGANIDDALISEGEAIQAAEESNIEESDVTTKDDSKKSKSVKLFTKEDLNKVQLKIDEAINKKKEQIISQKELVANERNSPDFKEKQKANIDKIKQTNKEIEILEDIKVIREQPGKKNQKAKNRITENTKDIRKKIAISITNKPAYFAGIDRKAATQGMGVDTYAEAKEYYQRSLESNLAVMITEDGGWNPNIEPDLETFVRSRGFLRAKSLAKELGVADIREIKSGIGITKDVSTMVDLESDDDIEGDIDKAPAVTPRSKIKQGAPDLVTQELEDLVETAVLELEEGVRPDVDDKTYKAFVQEVLEGKLTNEVKNRFGKGVNYDNFIKKFAPVLMNSMPPQFFVKIESQLKPENRQFTNPPKRLTTQAQIDKAMRSDQVYLENTAQGVNMYKLKNFSTRDLANFLLPPAINPATGKKSGNKGNIKTSVAKSTAVELGKDMIPSVMEELGKSGKEIAIASVKAQRPQTIKFSKNDFKEILTKVSDLRSIGKALSKLEINSISVNDTNRKAVQTKIQLAFEKYGLDLNVFKAASFSNSGARSFRDSNGDIYYDLTNNKNIKGIPVMKDGEHVLDNKGKKRFTAPSAEMVVEKFGEGVKLVADRGRVYYGVTDPAYIKALETATKNTPEGKRKDIGRKITPPETGITSKFLKDNKEKSDNNMKILNNVAKQLEKAVANGMAIEEAALIIAQGYQATTGLIKIAAPFKYRSKIFEYAFEGKDSDKKGKKYREEHNPPASVVGASLIAAIDKGQVDTVMEGIRENYFQVQLSKQDDTRIDIRGLASTLPAGYNILDNSAIRLIDSGINLNSIINPLTGKSMAQELGAEVDPKFQNDPNVVSLQNDLLKQKLEGIDVNIKGELKAFLPIASAKTKAGKKMVKELNGSEVKNGQKNSKSNSNEVIRELGILDKALKIARDPNAPIKKIRAFDFDDTVARTKSNVLYTMPDGKQGSLTAEQFAQRGTEMEANGAQFDFSEFNKVVDGKKGPLFEVMKKMQDAAGERDMFILTARSPEAAPAIQRFLKELGVDIPIENITGLGDSSPLAKSGWIVDKAAEGYNDFYFADDHGANVEAVQEALDALPVKGKTQQAKVKFSMNTKRDLKWKNHDFRSISKFEIEGKTYTIDLAKSVLKGSKDYTLSFGLDRKDKEGFIKKDHFVTGTGNAAEVLSIISNGVVDFVKNNKVDSIHFTSFEGSRTRLYTTLTKLWARKLDWNHEIEYDPEYEDMKGAASFIISKTKFSSTPVQKALNVVDIKYPTQQAKAKFSKNASDIFNDIIENKTGVEANKVFSDAKAKVRGRSKGRGQFFIPPSAEDFEGLLYKTLGKGKLGNEQKAWYKKALFDPFARAMNDMAADERNMIADFKAIKKVLKDGGIPKNLNKKALDSYTYSDVARILAWDEQGIKIEGLNDTDLKRIKRFAKKNPAISVFAKQLIDINKGTGYKYPGVDWLVGTITTDLMSGLNTTKRSEHLSEWQANVDLIFSKENLNKVEATMGPKYREALENSLYRMKTGKNRSSKGNRIENQLLEYLNNSVGAVMFFNMRSAALQTLSTVNFANWGFNNPAKMAKAFANQPQYWKDFMELMNSDFLVTRRKGLRINVSESEIADAAATGTNKAKGAINFILKKGFLPTQFADSFAIASGGATFYRNRINDLVKNEGMSKADAQVKAYQEFREIAEESQQSSRPDKISQQQSSGIGRVILAFANTPSQYARIIKKSTLDLVNGRGDWRHNMSKILYYGFAQNLIFNALQQAIFAWGWDEDEEDDEKEIRIANGMLDSILRGLGWGGALVSALKNVGIDAYGRLTEEDPGFRGMELWKSGLKFLDFAPPIDVKISKLMRAGSNWEFNAWRPEASNPFDIDNPAYKSIALVVAATTNVPIDRLFQKQENVRNAVKEEQENWKRIALLFGYPEWQLESSDQRADRQQDEKEEKRDRKAQDKLELYTKIEQEDILKQHGLDDEQISNLKNETERVEAIKYLNDKFKIKPVPSAKVRSEIKAKKEEKKAEKKDTENKKVVAKEKVKEIIEKPKEKEIIEKSKPKKVSFVKPTTSKRKKIKIGDRTPSQARLYKLKKSDQVDTLKSLGMSNSQIERLKYEEDRVRKIEELYENTNN